ncbi:hypothetical protein BJ684DRAFT_16465 [Piptocephalis cylindrospora]|uniref:Uncharacterized protein n=1 Tax=Piptocephalis cylindrospora TaxID=1907219 RepID=A0A4P9Y355_9FUNG|nr:hypothetical protein BJ684DRAFT_16465 [Piptocephalis cylindrospora]|eukprot:RKP13104.1 hypothetical protein BJ684DRAFT_16465 [Piptocephalis cylindrospora]
MYLLTSYSALLALLIILGVLNSTKAQQVADIGQLARPSNQTLDASSLASHNTPTASDMASSTPGEALSLVAQFGNQASNGINGTVEIRMAAHQDSPIDKTKDVDMTLTGFPAAGFYYLSINEFPIESEGDCSSAGRIYDPDGVLGNQTSPPPSSCRPTIAGDCSLGDLSGKWKAIRVTNQTQASSSPLILKYRDPSLMFEGANSIVNRSVVIRGSDGSSRIACSNLITQMSAAKIAPDAQGVPRAQANDASRSRISLSLLLCLFSSVVYG